MRPVPSALTAQDIAALAAAYSVTFLFAASTNSAVVQAAPLWSVSKNAETLFPETDEDYHHRVRNIACGVEITGYRPDFRFDVAWTERDAISTVCGARVVRNNPFWSTALRLLQPGNRLIQHWFADTGNDAVRSAGLTADELILRVDRDESPLRFHLLSHVTTPDDSSRLVVRGAEANADEASSAAPRRASFRDRR